MTIDRKFSLRTSGSPSPLGSRLPLTELLDRLGKLPLFADLWRRALMQVAEFAKERVCAQGEDVIVEDAGRTREFFVVMSGLVELRYVTAGGSRPALIRIGRGEIFVGPGVHGGTVGLVRARAVKDTTLVAFDADDLRELLCYHPTVALRLLEKFAGAMRDIARSKRKTAAEIRRAALVQLSLATLFPDLPGAAVA